MNREEISKIVIEELVKITEGDASEITEELSLIEDLDLSSLEVMTLLGTLTDRFDVKFDETDLRSIDTVEDMIECVLEKQ